MWTGCFPLQWEINQSWFVLFSPESRHLFPCQKNKIFCLSKIHIRFSILMFTTLRSTGTSRHYRGMYMLPLLGVVLAFFSPFPYLLLPLYPHTHQLKTQPFLPTINYWNVPQYLTEPIFLLTFFKDSFSKKKKKKKRKKKIFSLQSLWYDWRMTDRHIFFFLFSFFFSFVTFSKQKKQGPQFWSRHKIAVNQRVLLIWCCMEENNCMSVPVLQQQLATFWIYLSGIP